MALVKVKLFAMPGVQMSESNHSIELENGPGIGEALVVLIKRFGKRFSEALFREPGVLRSYVRIFLNGEPLSDLTAEIPAAEGVAEVGIILPAAT